MVRHAKILPLVATWFIAGCGADPATPPTLDVDIFGWDGGQGFVSSLPDLNDAQSVRVKLTQPMNRMVVATKTTPVAARSANIPDLQFGDNLRLDFEVLDSQGQLIGAGATPRFNFEAERQLLSFRVQVTAVNTFSPVGNVVVDRESGERKFAWTQLDYRGKEGVTWLGRLGHATAATSDGRILVVGGGDPVPGSGPGALPAFRSVYDDVQIFDPETGYFTDLAYDDKTGLLRPDSGDRLFEPSVFHTLTAIGDDKFVVSGGFTPRSDVMRPVNTLQLIDLSSPAGSRVQRLVDNDGSSLVLEKARGFHTATYRALDKHLIVAGGLGPQGDDDVLATFEMIDLAARSVYQDPFELEVPRAQHSAVLMGDGRTVWLVGGRSKTAALASTEVVKLADSGTTSSTAEGTMRTGRFGLGAVKISAGGGDILLVAGGFTDLDGAVDDSFEVSRLGRGTFDTGTTWKLSRGRGGLTAIELPQSQDVILLGGRAADGSTLATGDVLRLDDLASQPPYTAKETRSSPTPRFRSSVDLLSSGRILLVGGEGAVNGAPAGLDTADIFNPNDPVGGESTVVISQ